MAPESLPGSPHERNRERDLFLLSCFMSGAALGALLGRSWPLLALSWRLLGRAWPSRGAPGSHFRHPGASFGTCLGLFFRRLWKNTKTLIFDDSCSENQGFGVPGGSKIEPRWLPNRSWARLGASWRSLGASRRCPWRLLPASWRSWGLLGASWGALEAILTQKGNPPDPLRTLFGPQPGVDPDRLSPSTLPL